MRKAVFGAVVWAVGFAATASAQNPYQFGQQPGYGGGSPQGGYGYPQGGYGYPPAANGAPQVMPNIYNPQTQPLSPYLNLTRGGNAATNYYYGVRPGTLGGAGAVGGGAPNMAMGGNRPPFVLQFATGPDPLGGSQAVGGGPTFFPSPGHPAYFGNTLGYFPGSIGRGFRPGSAGTGTPRPATPTSGTPRR